MFTKGEAKSAPNDRTCLSGSDTYIIVEATLDVKAIHLTLQVNTLLASSKPRMGPSTESVPHRFEHPTNSHH
jgi:hypothetical protein